MNALTLELRLGHRRKVNELIKIRFGLIILYQCFQCCRREFALFHSIQDSGEINKLSIQCRLHKYKWDLLRN